MVVFLVFVNVVEFWKPVWVIKKSDCNKSVDVKASVHVTFAQVNRNISSIIDVCCHHMAFAELLSKGLMWNIPINTSNTAKIADIIKSFITSYGFPNFFHIVTVPFPATPYSLMLGSP